MPTEPAEPSRQNPASGLVWWTLIPLVVVAVRPWWPSTEADPWTLRQVGWLDPTTTWATSVADGFRPTTDLSFRVVSWLGGMAPRPHHLLDLAALVVTGLALAGRSWRTGAGGLAGLAAALVVWFHPSAAGVTDLAQRSGGLAAALVAAAAAVSAGGRSAPVAGGLLAAAVGAEPQAMVAAIALAAWSAEDRRRRALLFGPSAAVAVVRAGVVGPVWPLGLPDGGLETVRAGTAALGGPPVAILLLAVAVAWATSGVGRDRVLLGAWLVGAAAARLLGHGGTDPLVLVPAALMAADLVASATRSGAGPVTRALVAGVVLSGVPVVAGSPVFRRAPPEPRRSEVLAQVRRRVEALPAGSTLWLASPTADPGEGGAVPDEVRLPAVFARAVAASRGARVVDLVTYVKLGVVDPPVPVRTTEGVVVRIGGGVAYYVDPDGDGTLERRSPQAPRDLPLDAETGWFYRVGDLGPAVALDELPVEAAEVVVRTRPPDRAYNVLLVVVDTLRADRLGAWGHGHPTSPNLDRLARRSLRFSRSIAQAPWTTPSMGALMTSRYPSMLGLVDEDALLPDDAVTLAETLRAAGLRTHGIVSHTFCGTQRNFDQGFDSFDESNILGHTGSSSPGVSDRATAWLDEHGRETPFFLWLHYFDPHFAYTLHPETDPAPTRGYEGPVQSDLRFASLVAMTDELTDPDLRQLERLYDSEVAFTDAAIGRVLDHLDQLGLRDSTLVVFTADHGEEFLDHGRLGHGKTLYQELVHVPTMVSCPHWPTGVVTSPVGNIDLFPTVLACLGLERPPDLLGAPLGPEGGPEAVFSEGAKRGHGTSITSGRWQYLSWRKRAELYDLDADPTQLRDLSEVETAVAADLASRLEAWSRVLTAGTRASVMHETTDAERAALEALGYVGDE